MKILEEYLSKKGTIKSNAPSFIKNLYYKRELYKVTKTIICSESISRAKDKISLRCTSCGYRWKAVLNNVTQGQGCPSCSNRVKYSNVSLENKLKDLHPSLEIIGDFVDMKTPLLVRCSLHNYIYKVTPKVLVAGHGCRLCYEGKQKFTHEDFVKKIATLSPNLEITGVYTGSKERVQVRCKVHDKVWEPFAYALLAGQGCSRCSNNEKKSHDTFLKELEDRHKDLVCKDVYINSSTKLNLECQVCNYSFQSTPNTLLAGHGCPKCAYQDKDCLYYWRDDLGNYKIGVTRWSLGDKRVKDVARLRNTEYSGLRKVETRYALALEKQLLLFFTNNSYITGEGYSEFRSLTDYEKELLDLVFDKIEEDPNMNNIENVIMNRIDMV